MSRILSVGVLCAASFSCVTPLLADVVFMSEVEGSKRIVQMNNDGSSRRFVTEDGVWSLYPDISADGSILTYVQGPGPEELAIVVQNTKTSEKTQYKIEGQGMHLHPDLSGDGRYLAFSGPHPQTGKQQIYIVDRQLDGAQPVRFEDDADCYFPTLSSDGMMLVYQRNLSAKKREIVEVDLATKKSKVISPAGVDLNMAPALSFDDRFVAYTSQQSENWDVYLYDRLNAKTTRATFNPANDFAPNFAPDGSLVFSSNRESKFQLYRIEAAQLALGKEDASLLATSEGDLYAPVYSGDLSYQQEILAPILEPARSSFGVATLNERVYIVGGHQGREHTYPPESFLSNVEYYDLKTGEWGVVAPRSLPCHGFEVVAHGKYLYAFGGFAYSADHKPKWRSLDEVERYDPETNTWEIIGKMPRRRSSYVIGEADGKAYIIGGWDSTPKRENDYEGTFQRAIDIFDFEKEAFVESKLELPDPLRRAFTAVTKGDEVYLIGGLGQGATHFELLDRVTVFNTKTESWSERPSLPFATFAPAATFLNGDLHVFGGMFKTGPMDYVYVNHIYRLDQETAWKNTGRYLSEAKGFARVSSINDSEALILGGHQYFLDGSDAPTSTVEKISLK